MIQRCIYYFTIVLVFTSCSEKDNFQENFKEFDLKFEESKVLNDGIGFFQKPDKIELVSDSMIIAFSGFSGLSIYNISNNNQVGYIDPIKNPKRALLFSSFDANDFPNIYLLEAKQNKIHVYNFEEKRYVDVISLELEEGTSIRSFGGKFKSYKSEFYVELNPEGTSMLDPDYYKNSGKFLGVFNKNGSLKSRVIEYPNELTNNKGYFIPANYYDFDIYDDKLFICFPFEKLIRVYDINSTFDNYQSISFPSLDYMELDLINIPIRFHPQDFPINDRQISSRIRDLVIDEDELFLSFGINDNKSKDRWREFTSLFKLDLKTMKWNVQSQPHDIFDFGIFVGSSNEKLVYLDAALNTKDDKFINLAELD